MGPPPTTMTTTPPMPPVDASDQFLDYGAVDTADASRRATGTMMAFFVLFAAFAHFASFIVAAVCIPGWRGMGTKLPAITMLLAGIGQWVALGWGWVALWAAAIGAPFVIGRLYPRWPREHNGAYVLLALAAMLVAMMTFLLLAIAAPMITIGR